MTRGFLYSIYLNLSQRVPQLHGQGLLIQQGALGIAQQALADRDLVDIGLEPLLAANVIAFWPEASPQLFSIFQRSALPFSSRLTPQNIMQWFMVLSRVSSRSALVMPKVRPPSTSPYWKQSGSQ